MTDRLTEADKKHWHPPAELLWWLIDQIPSSARVLDVGGGILPFPRADVIVDFNDPERVPPNAKIVKCDFVRDGLPFADKSFDFVYCRHVIEDIYDPLRLLREIERVGKAGYIETPSPIAELCLGVDGTERNDGIKGAWRGYYHHLFIAWVVKGELRLVSKYPLIEHSVFDGGFAEALREGPRYWNTHYVWRDRMNVRFYQHVVDYNLTIDYGPMLAQGCDSCVASNDEFWAPIPQRLTAAQLRPAPSAA